MLGADAEAVGAEHFRDLHDGAAAIEAEIADDDVGFIDEDAGAAAQGFYGRRAGRRCK